MNNRDTIPTIKAQVEVIHAVDTESQITVLFEDRSFRGTVRHGVWSADGLIVNEDIRDAYVRITTAGGWDAFLPFADLVERRMEHMLMWEL